MRDDFLAGCSAVVVLQEMRGGGTREYHPVKFTYHGINFSFLFFLICAPPLPCSRMKQGHKHLTDRKAEDNNQGKKGSSSYCPVEERSRNILLHALALVIDVERCGWAG